MRTFIYTIPDSLLNGIGIISGLIGVISLIFSIFTKNKYIKIFLIVTGVIIFLVYFCFNSLKKDLVEMPKVTPNTYANVVQTLNEYGINYKTDNEVSDFINTIVHNQSIKEGDIINKKKDIVILYIENKNDNGDDTKTTATIQPPETDDSTSHENTTTSDNENQDTGSSSLEKLSEDELETKTFIPETEKPTETISLSLDNNCENEPNNDFTEATPINVNQSYIGNIQTKFDKDYFSFEISQKGSVSITFNHELFDNNFEYWEIHLVSDEKTFLIFYSNGKPSSLTSNIVRLPAGTYYLRITPCCHSDIDYNFSVNYNPENEFFESEPNNDYKFATNINLDVEYTGNIQSERDIDFYEINIIEDNTDIELNFLHEIYDKNSNYWRIYIFDENGKQIAILDKNNEWFAYISVRASEPKTKIYINDLACGKYYIKICADIYMNDDYSFLVNKV